MAGRSHPSSGKPPRDRGCDVGAAASPHATARQCRRCGRGSHVAVGLIRVNNPLDPSALQWLRHETRIPHPPAQQPPPCVAGGLDAAVAAGGGSGVCVRWRTGIGWNGRGGDAFVFDGGDGQSLCGNAGGSGRSALPAALPARSCHPGRRAYGIGAFQCAGCAAADGVVRGGRYLAVGADAGAAPPFARATAHTPAVVLLAPDLI